MIAHEIGHHLQNIVGTSEQVHRAPEREQKGADGLSVVRATAHAVWGASADGRPITVAAGDDAARAALERWSVPNGPDPLA